MKKSVYISYIREDQHIAHEVASVFSQCGYSVFVDLKELTGDDNFAELLTGRLKSAERVVYIVSEASLSSQWCRREVEYASRHGKEVIPILICSAVREKYLQSWFHSINNRRIIISWDNDGNRQLCSLLSYDVPKTEAESNQAYCPPNPTCVNSPRPYFSDRNFTRENLPQKRSLGVVGWIILVDGIVLLIALYLFFSTNVTAPDESQSSATALPEFPSDVIEDRYVDSILGDNSEWVTDTMIADSMLTLEQIGPSQRNDAQNDSIRTSVEEPLSPNIVDSRYEKGPDEEFETNGGNSGYIWLIALLVVLFGCMIYGIYIKRKVRIKLIANKDCTVYVDNENVIELEARRVAFVYLAKGQYYITFSPLSENFDEKSIAVTVDKKDMLINIDFADVNPTERNTIKCFIAGSTKLEAERNALRSGIAQTHNAWRGKNFEILSFTYEDFDRKVVDGGHQSKYDEFIETEATIAVFIISGEIGEFTISEFEKAMYAFKKGRHPQILVFNDIHAPVHEQAETLAKMVTAQKQYWADYDSINTLKLQFIHTLDWMLIEMFYK